ncbi:hypothetical protein SERLADRAFT_404367 [Serpula lacrymans var. lacrymans S7.9]|uniref:Uncharacterized protein n=1 Tax=Serpula lacrymans var. lacrymans (strain S7.9) TaxID=578457 RepID=F8PEP6_SERL9|nr:uncharacterized protein SERLADRAFT_404367 [Serpula lacrymans var. lacrymans S7.9]EGO18399.1 hypothetical protein SERLADRAFT_404367 [Serpula lacrymans var. lacrymans S7.9]
MGNSRRRADKMVRRAMIGPNRVQKASKKRSRRVLRLPSAATGLRLCSPFNSTLILTEKSPRDSVG